MTIYGIIAAMKEEMAEIKKIMTDTETVFVYGKEIIKGKIQDKDCVLSICGVGKVNSARTTQILIDKFSVDTIINVGSAGALTAEQKVGDIVISTHAVQTDFDLTAFGNEKGYISGIGKLIPADKYLISVMEQAVENHVGENTIRKGVVATADKFVSNGEDKSLINKEFSALCCEMEGAAMAQVCYLCKVPFVILRSISDDLYSQAEIDFNKFLQVASVKCAEFLNSAFKIIE